MTDRVKINVRQAELDKYGKYIKDRIRSAILEHMHSYTPGYFAGMMSDLRATAFIEPVDATPAPPPEKTKSRQQHDRELQDAERVHTSREQAARDAASAARD